MKQWEKVAVVQKMQDYIAEHVEDDPALLGLYPAVGYSRRHADRLFRSLLGMTPVEYGRKVRLSRSAEELLAEESTVLEISLSKGFDTQEGYSRAFADAYGLSPGKYRRNPRAIPLFKEYPVEIYYRHLLGEEPNEEKVPVCCTVTAVKRPRRKLLFLRSREAADYWSFCQEAGCGWEGLLDSIPEKFDTAAILSLPPFLQKEGYTSIAAGVELPLNYDKPLPQGYEMAGLPACTMLYFQSGPFTDERDYEVYLKAVFKAVDTYDPTHLGLAFAPELAPQFNFGASGPVGAKLALPVKGLENEGPLL